MRELRWYTVITAKEADNLGMDRSDKRSDPLY